MHLAIRADVPPMLGKRVSRRAAPQLIMGPLDARIDPATLCISAREDISRQFMIAFADQYLVGLCRFSRYAERLPGMAGEPRKRPPNIGMTLGRPRCPGPTTKYVRG